MSAVITNLAGELALVDRMQDALAGEMVRRQEALRTAGNLASVHEYGRAREQRADLPALPSLLIVVDEFSELLTAKPELTELFVAIGRLGRSLGLHLLLASQRLEEGRLRGLDSHLSYRVGLRTFSAQESRTVLGVPDAYELPSTPGLGYLKPDPTTLTRFQAAYVSGPPSTDQAVRRRGARPAPLVLPFVAREVRAPRTGLAVTPGHGPRRPALGPRARRRPDAGPRPGRPPDLAPTAGPARLPGTAAAGCARSAADPGRDPGPAAGAAPRRRWCST